MNEQITTQTLISDIEFKNRRFRVAQTVFVFFLVIGFILLILIQQRTLNTSQKTLLAVQSQLDQQKTIVADIKKDNTEQLNRLNRHLDCIVVFFGSDDRANSSIEDVNKCTINTTEGPVQFFSTSQGLRTDTPVQSVNQSPTQKVAVSSTPSPSPTPTPVQSSSNPGPIAQNPQQAGSLTTPLNIIGIPICLPIVQICLEK